VRRCHQKRPDRQVAKTHLHADPSRVMMPHQGVDSETEQKRRDGIADCLPGSAMPRSAAPRTTQPMAKAWPSAIGERTRAATNCWERDQRPLPPRGTSSQVRSTGFGSAITLCGGGSQRRRHRAGRKRTPPYPAQRWA
jgi:hypothetical protein